jgi:pullulanase-type alpha-1,6-glucosidase
MKILFRSIALLLLLTLTVFSAAAQADQPSLVVIPGTIQSVLGCPGDWQPDCPNTALTYDAVDDLWSATFALPAGSYEYKVALNGSWDVNYGAGGEQGGANIRLLLERDTQVRFIYHHGTHWVTDSVNSLIVNVPGSYQTHIGCPGAWQPTCLRSLLQDPDGDGVYVFSTTLIPAGAYEAKVAANESWSLNWGDGGARDGANIPFVVESDGQLVEFRFDTTNNNTMTIIVGGRVPPKAGNLTLAQAHWLTADTIAWAISRIPGAEYRLYSSAEGGLTLDDSGISGSENYITLRADRAGIGAALIARFPHLRDYTALKVQPDDLARVPEMLRGQLALISLYNQGIVQDATSVQIAGVLDDLYATDAPLGIIFNEQRAPLFNLWAPTAQSVRVHVYETSTSPEAWQVQEMSHEDGSGVWQYWGEPDWYGKFYLYEVTVYAPTTGRVETNFVTDPYSFSLSMNSARSHIIDLNDPETQPAGWSETAKPPLDAPEDIVLYELHVRDFSIYDASVPAAHRGTFLAFTHPDSAGMQHLTRLSEAGLTHVHLLPVFDIATINENRAAQTTLSRAALAALPPDSPDQQALVDALRDRDGFNWGYDPFHYTAPEGSYSTDPDGAARVREFRQMVQALNAAGLRVVMDVVYNHTNAAGQNERSVLDRIVPGYYHRLSLTGRVETSTCCPNTATEHAMMERLMLDSLRTWATQYKVDGFRFDLMGHHMRANMENVRALLDSLTVEADGVDGAQIYVYGEGWNFGEVADNARGVNATQINMAGTGIGTFNDRVRDAVRGGNPFGGLQEQGFATGLVVDPNGLSASTPEADRERLLRFQDQIRVALAGNLRDYTFTSASGEQVTGAQIDYNGAPAGYTLDPQEHIVYVEAHDNETFFDVIQTKAPADLPLADRIRMHNLGIDIVLFSQGVPFIHAGQEMLRSKSGDKDSYNSGDWFNHIDWTYQDNGWGRGLPIADKNRDNWGIWQPLLANPDLAPSEAQIRASIDHFERMLRIRMSSPLFRLRTAEQIAQVVRFHNTGPDQTPGLIVMELNDMVGESIDPTYSSLWVLFNAAPEAVSFSHETLVNFPLGLHMHLAQSGDPVYDGATFDPATGTITVPARTTVVFVSLDQYAQ